jgi:hypothetical protein
MSILSVLWIVWAALATILLAMLAYRGNLTRYEEDCLFLGDCESTEKLEQERILAKVRKIRTPLRMIAGVTCVMSAALIGIYIWQAIQQFNLTT